MLDAAGVDYVDADSDTIVINTRKAVINKKDSFVLFLDDEYRTGTDVKFGKEAMVVIVSEKEKLDGEEVLQMLGRGNRNKAGQYVGYVYMIGPPKLKQAAFDGFINKATNIDFLDCVRVLRLLRLTYLKESNADYQALQKMILKYLV